MLRLFKKEARSQLIFLGFIMPLAVILVSQCNHLIIHIQPRTIDASLSRLDDGLSVAIYHWTLHHSLIHSFLWIVYYGLPLFIALVLGISDKRMACLRAIILAAIFAPIFYYLFPAVGPAHVGQHGAPRNCIPSLHLTWALQLVLYSQSHLRYAAIIFLVPVAAATLGMGEHYVVDLVVAVPYTLVIYWLEARLSHFLPAANAQSLPAPEDEKVC